MADHIPLAHPNPHDPFTLAHAQLFPQPALPAKAAGGVAQEGPVDSKLVGGWLVLSVVDVVAVKGSTTCSVAMLVGAPA